MKALRKIVFVLILVSTNFVYGQKINTNTPYKRKVVEIYTKYMRKMGMSATEIEALKKKGLKAFSDGYANAVMKTKDGFSINRLVNQEVMSARSLMNAEERKAEELKKKREEENRRLKEIREKEEEERKKEKKYIEKSDLNKIKKEVKTAFEKWAKKGEFEKTEEYNARMRYKEKILEGFIESKVYDKMRNYDVYKIKYDADTEIYDIEINSRIDDDYDDYDYDDYPILYTKKLNGQIKIEPSLARRLGYGDLKFNKSFEYRFFKDGYIYPNHIVFNDKVYMITFPEEEVSSSNYKMSDFTFSTDDLGLSQYFSENKMIKLSDIKLVRNGNRGIVLNSGAISLGGSIEDGYKNLVDYFSGRFTYAKYKNEGAFSFDIDEEGKVSNIAVRVALFERTVSYYARGREEPMDFTALEREIIRIIKNTSWRPAVKDGVPVKDNKVYYFSHNGKNNDDIKIIEYKTKQKKEEIKAFINKKK